MLHLNAIFIGLLPLLSLSHLSWQRVARFTLKNNSDGLDNAN